MALPTAEAFASHVQRLAALLPDLADISPLTWDAPDGTTYYYTTYRLHGRTETPQTDQSRSPLEACRLAKKTIERDLLIPQPTPA